MYKEDMHLEESEESSRMITMKRIMASNELLCFANINVAAFGLVGFISDERQKRQLI